jgi:hypothetical protein
VGLFCQSIQIPSSSAFDDPFLGPTTFQINGFCFPMPTTGENAICPQFCGTTAPLCRGGKSVTYSIVYKFDENGDGVVDATIPFADPDVVVIDENTITVTVDFSQTNLCGGDVEICVFATYGFGDDNKYFENNGTPVVLTCASTLNIGPRDTLARDQRLPVITDHVGRIRLHPLRGPEITIARSCAGFA